MTEINERHSVDDRNLGSLNNLVSEIDNLRLDLNSKDQQLENYKEEVNFILSEKNDETQNLVNKINELKEANTMISESHALMKRDLEEKMFTIKNLEIYMDEKDLKVNNEDLTFYKQKYQRVLEENSKILDNCEYLKKEIEAKNKFSVTLEKQAKN